MDGHQRLRQATLALYHGNHDVQAEANAWLTQFQRSPEAWQAAHAVFGQHEPPEVLFLSVSILLRKTRLEWHKIGSETMCHQLSAAFSQMLSGALSWTLPPPSTLLRQLCLLQAAALAPPSPPSQAADLCTQAITMLSSTAPLIQLVGLELLQAVAEETKDIMEARRSGQLVDTLISQTGIVLQSLQYFLTTINATQKASTRDGYDGWKTSAIRAAHAWLRLDKGPAEWGPLGPAGIHAEYPSLWSALLSAVTHSASAATFDHHEESQEAATRTLLGALSSRTFGPTEDHDDAALSALIDALLTQIPSMKTMSETSALNLAQLGASAAERWPEGVCGAVPNSQSTRYAEPLAHLMLECLRRKESSVAEVALEYFFVVSTVPVETRPPSLRAPLFESMMDAVRFHVEYHNDSRGNTDVDEDDFRRMRDSIAPEALEEAFGLVQEGYVQRLLGILSSSETSTWQAVESVIYMLGAVSLPIRTKVLGTSQKANGAGRIGQLINGLHALWNLLLVHQRMVLVNSHPRLAATTCWAIERFAVWFGKDDRAPLAEAFDAVLDCLGRTGLVGDDDLIKTEAAALAFYTLCLRSHTRLNAMPDLRAGLHSRVLTILSSVHFSLDLEQQKLLVKGLSHVTAHLTDSQQSVAACMELIAPFAHQLHSIITSAENGEFAGEAGEDKQQRYHVCRYLHLTSAALQAILSASLSNSKASVGPRAQDGGAGGAGGDSDSDPASCAPVQMLMAVAGPIESLIHLQNKTWQKDEEVSFAIADVYKQALCSARSDSSTILPIVIPQTLQLFAASIQPACLDVLTEALEIHFQDQSAIELLAKSIDIALNQVAFPALNQGAPPLPTAMELSISVLALADAMAVYVPAMLWTSALLRNLIDLATNAVCCRETEIVIKSLAFLGQVVNLTMERVAEDSAFHVSHVEAVWNVLMDVGDGITSCLVHCLCETCPRQFVCSAADKLKSLMLHPGITEDIRRMWMHNAISRVMQHHNETLDPAVCSKFLELVFTGTVRGPRLTSLLMDFGLIARREEGPDVLLAHEL